MLFFQLLMFFVNVFEGSDGVPVYRRHHESDEDGGVDTPRRTTHDRVVPVSW